jgi:hypothetical protein
MDSFEAAYLACRSDSRTSRFTPFRELAFIPGPTPVRGMTSSVEIEDLPAYPIESVRGAIMAHAGFAETILEDPPGVSFLEWRKDSRTMLIEVNPPDSEDWPFWSGSSLETNCTFADLLEVWLTLLSRLPGTWLHNSHCQMFAPDSFVEQLALPSLRVALASVEAATRERAERERVKYLELLKHYESLLAP